MAQVQESIDVNVPVRDAYNQWTQFESFPNFMDGVVSITQLDDTHNHWVTKVGGATREFDTEVTEQNPDERIAWKSVGGDTKHAGVVTFHRIDDGQTRVTLQLDVDPEGPVENIGDAIGLVRGRVKGDLERFEKFVETRGSETGAWRGTVDQSAS